ncbi:MAG: sigma-70 family RNA polymerase sigma factor [Pirellulales bacterium]
MTRLPETRYTLLARLQQVADHEAWSEFIDAYQDALFRYVRSRGLQDADAWEVVQDVFVAVHRSIDRWSDSTRTNFRPWLLRVAYNLTISHLRRKQRQAVLAGDSTWREVLARPASEMALSSNDEDRRQWQQWAFCWAAGQVQRQVSPAVWQAFWLTAIDRQPPAEVGRQLGMTVGAVYAAKCRVLARLRESAHQLDPDSAGSESEVQE